MVADSAETWRHRNWFQTNYHVVEPTNDHQRAIKKSAVLRRRYLKRWKSIMITASGFSFWRVKMTRIPTLGHIGNSLIVRPIKFAWWCVFAQCGPGSAACFYIRFWYLHLVNFLNLDFRFCRSWLVVDNFKVIHLYFSLFLSLPGKPPNRVNRSASKLPVIFAWKRVKKLHNIEKFLKITQQN